MQQLPITRLSYNPMSMQQAGRWEDVDRELARIRGVSVVGLQGTRDMLELGCEQHRTQNFQWQCGVESQLWCGYWVASLRGSCRSFHDGDYIDAHWYILVYNSAIFVLYS